MKLEKVDPDKMPQCPYCPAKTPMYTDASGGRAEPKAGDVSICLMCSGVALFTGDGVQTRRPDRGEEMHEVLSRRDVSDAIQLVNHIRNHHMP